MELSQNNNQSLSLSLLQNKNNSEKSKVWEVAKQSQLKSASRLHLDGKNQTSKEIIENFTTGLNKETNKVNQKKNNFIIQNKSIHENKLKPEAIQSKTESKIILDNSRKISPNLKNNLDYAKNNTKLTQNFIKSSQDSLLKFTKNPKLKLSFSPVIDENKKLNKSEDRTLASSSKKESKVLDSGHNQIIHEIENEQENKNKNDSKNKQNQSTDFANKLENDSKKANSFENSKIEISYTEDNNSNFDSQNSNDNFKDSLLHLLNHFNTKIKGNVNGDKLGEFEINTEFGKLSVKIQREKNHLSIDINSDLIYEFKGQLESIENAILDKMPEIDSITINTSHLSFDYQPEKNNFKNKEKATVTQDSLFKLNYLA